MPFSIYFRHEKVRDGQKQLIADIITCLDEKKHLIAHASTGLGKTDSSLSPAIKYAVENEKTVFFCTPKISQHKIAVESVKETADKYNLGITAVDLVGKKHMCTDESMRSMGSEEMYEMCRKRRKDDKCPHYSFARGSNLVQKAKARNRLNKIKEWHGNAKEHQELVNYCSLYKDRSILTPPCAYETALQLGEKAEIIICDYHHILNPFVSESIMGRMEKQIEDSVIIIDEAHNAPEKIRNSLSVSLDEKTVMRAKNECRTVGNAPLMRQIEKIHSEILLIEKNSDEKERTAHKEELPIFGNEFLSELYETGVHFLESSGKYRSHCLRLLSFYEKWLKDSDAFIRIVKKHDQGVRIYYKCLDPSVVTADRLNSAHSAILMSGTLKPGEMYRDILGLDEERTIIREYNSPFPRENQLSLIASNVTTKFEKRSPEEFEKIAITASSIVNETPGNSAVFFPSFKVMNQVKPFLNMNKKAFIQEEKQKPDEAREILSRFRKMKSEGAVLMGVTGGSFSEGIDYPGSDLLAAVIVGIPLSEPDLETKALIRYYDLKFGKGWEYGYSFPAMSKAVQAAGRVIRDEKDRGVIAFLDSRYSMKKYSQCFPSYYNFTVTENPEKQVKEFWNHLK